MLNLFQNVSTIARVSSSCDEVDSTNKQHRVWPILFLALAQGCVTYESMPLDQTTVAARLASPSMDAIRVQAKEIQHPILKPIDFDIRNGLSPDEAAILAVLANPKLRSVRDQRGIAAAQLLQVGILPNPQLSYSLGIPTGGMTQGTINAYN